MIGQTLGHYRILEKVGSGGMGVVYRARDEQLERDVALKVLPSGTLGDEASRRHFRKEALALAKLSHPNIETIYEFDTQDGTDFLVMEYVPGKTLADTLANGALPEKEVVTLGIQIAAAMEEAHERGIVHRDLKPRNIAITGKGRAKVLDFGLAKLLTEINDATADSLADTQAGAGTLPYMSPEQLQGKAVDARADIYTIGAILYEMATDFRAFNQQALSQMIQAILHEQPQPPRRLNSRISPELERMILKCLDKAPGRRYQSAKELLVDLQRLDADSTAHSTPAPRPRLSWWHRVAPAIKYAAAVIIAAVGVLAVTNAGGWRDRLLGRTRPLQIRSLAVLPFDNLSGDPDQQYFADGMTEALITDLGQIQALRVISRTSVMRYKSVSHPPLANIARDLKVDAVVEGSVSRVGSVARVTARLVYGPTETLIWSKSYQRELQNVLVLQGEVANAIVREIDVRLTPQEEARLTVSRQVDPAAHEAYLKGTYLRRGTPEQRQRSRQYFEQAISLDANYAPAYAGLASYYASNAELLPQVAMSQAESFAQKALQLDPTLTQAHVALGSVRFFGDWDPPAAEREFKVALELSPGDSEAHRAYASYLSALGRPEEAQAEIRQAQDVDPLYIATQITAGWVLYFSRQYDKALEQCQKALELDPNSSGAYDCLGTSYSALGMHQQAISACEKAVALSSNSPAREVGLGEAYAAAGDKNEARAVFRQLSAQASKTYVSPVFLARLHIAFGERSQAFEELEDAYQRHDQNLMWLKSERAYDPLRDDTRFADLSHRVGLPN